MPTIKLIVNPVSGNNLAPHWVSQIESVLRSADVDINVDYTTRVGDGTALAIAAVKEGYQQFGVVGGDGTINEVVNGLAGATSKRKDVGPLTIFPAGSGNDLAATLQFDRNPKNVAQRLLRQATKPIDIYLATVETPAKKTQRYFINNLGIGLEATVAQRYEQVRWVKGHLRYVVAALQTIFSYQPTIISAEWTTLQTDDSMQAWPTYLQTHLGSHSGPAMLVSVGNNCRAGGGFYLTPDAQLDDGFIDVGILRSVRKATLLKLLGLALKGKHVHHPAITMIRTPSLTVASHHPLPVQADGEIIALNAKKINVSIHSQKLQIVI